MTVGSASDPDDKRGVDTVLTETGWAKIRITVAVFASEAKQPRGEGLIPRRWVASLRSQ